MIMKIKRSEFIELNVPLSESFKTTKLQQHSGLVSYTK